MLCHGSGDLTRGGCCYVGGQVCPLRWKLANGHVYDHLGTDLGTLETFVAQYTKSKPRQQAIITQLTGVTFVCKAAADVIAEDPKRINNRSALEAAWNQHAEYVALVRPQWAKIEQELGLAPGSYNCSTWRGTGTSECCFKETPEENAAKAAQLPPEARAARTVPGV